MKRSFISTLIVCLVLQITLFTGCNPDEPGVGNADIGYEGFKSDAELFYEFAYRKESLILNALNYTSDGFTKAPFEGTISKSEFSKFFAELEELNKEADKYVAAIQKLESSGVLQRPTQTRGIFSSTKEFFSWVSGSGERNRERITTIASNMTAADRSRLYNGMRDEWKSKSKNEADFWKKLEDGDYDSSAGQIYNDFYHDGETEFSDLAQERGLTPQKIVVNEGAKGIETGANVVLDATSAVVPGFGTGTTVVKVGDNVEKMTKSESWKEAAEHGFHAVTDILEEVTGDIGYTGFNGSDVVNAIRNKVDETVFKKDDKEETKGKVSVTDKNKEKSKSIVIIEKKDGGSSSDGSPSIYTTTKNGISDGIDMLVKAGKWLVTVINEKGYRGTVEVDVEAGKVTVTEVNTQEPEQSDNDEIDSRLFTYMRECNVGMMGVSSIDPDTQEYGFNMGTSNEFYDTGCVAAPVRATFANNFFSASYTKTSSDDFYGTMKISGSISLTFDQEKKRIKTGTLQLVRNLDQPIHETTVESVCKVTIEDLPFKVENDKIIIEYSGVKGKEIKNISCRTTFSQPYGSGVEDFLINSVALKIVLAEKPE